MITLPAGKKIKVELDSPLSTATSKVGDTFTCTVSSAVHLKDGTIFAVEKGAKVEGSVIEVASAKRVKGLAKLTIKFDSLDLRGGERIPISGSLRTEAESTAKRDTAAIAGGAAAGAILGKLIGKDSKDAVIGAIAGGAIGTGVVLGTKGKEVEIPAGTDLVIQLDQPVDVPAPMAGA